MGAQLSTAHPTRTISTASASPVGAHSGERRSPEADRIEGVEDRSQGVNFQVLLTVTENRRPECLHRYSATPESSHRLGFSVRRATCERNRCKAVPANPVPQEIHRPR